MDKEEEKCRHFNLLITTRRNPTLDALDDETRKEMMEEQQDWELYMTYKEKERFKLEEIRQELPPIRGSDGSSTTSIIKFNNDYTVKIRQCAFEKVSAKIFRPPRISSPPSPESLIPPIKIMKLEPVKEDEKKGSALPMQKSSLTSPSSPPQPSISGVKMELSTVPQPSTSEVKTEVSPIPQPSTSGVKTKLSPAKEGTLEDEAPLSKIPRTETSFDNDHMAELQKVCGDELFNCGQYEKALTYYSRSISYKRGKDTLNNRAQTYIILKDHLSAIPDLDEVLDQDPRNLKALYRRAMCRIQIRMFREALMDAELLSECGGSKKASVVKELIKNCQARLRGRVYRIRENFGFRETFEVEMSQLPAYAMAATSGNYVVEMNNTGCYKECICGFCTSEDSRTKSSGLRIGEKPKWALITVELLNKMGIDVTKVGDLASVTDEEQSGTSGSQESSATTERLI